MSRSVGLAHIIRQDDGTSRGIWGMYTVCSAFQPIFRFDSTGKLSIYAFEGLVRPFRDNQGVSPGKFFSSIPREDAMEVETLTRTLHILNAGACLDPKTQLFVNFDPSVFTDKALSDRTLREMRLTLHEAGVDPSRIVCEVTEHRVSSHQMLLDFVQSLRDHGFRIAVDDYGADDSDIHRVHELKPEIVKFDAHWITHLMDSAEGYDLLREMVTTFESWGITTLFEGIEHHWQLDLAQKCGVQLIQGFVLARPQIAPTQFAVFSNGQGAPAQEAAMPEANREPVPPMAPALETLEDLSAEQEPPQAEPVAAELPEPARRRAAGTQARTFGRRKTV